MLFVEESVSPHAMMLPERSGWRRGATRMGSGTLRAGEAAVDGQATELSFSNGFNISCGREASAMEIDKM